MAARKIYEELDARLNQAGVVAGLQSTNVDMIDKALPPGEPSSTPWFELLVLGFLAGILIGILTAIGKNSLNRLILSESDVQRVSGFPLIGAIPRTRPVEEGGVLTDAIFPALSSSHSTGAEAFRSLRTSIELSRPSRAARVLVVNSSIPSEGKSYISMNLALVLAQRGGSALLIDADLRRGRLHSAMAIPQAPGLSQILSGVATLDECIVKFPRFEGLSILPMGPVPPSPADLLDSAAAASLLDECRRRFDYVVIDTPPLLVVSDAVILSRFADGIVMVVRSGVTTVQALRRSVDRLSPVKDKVIGTVFNDAQRGGSYYYYSHYYDSKGDEA
jgi:capsular exopolysaccharide synthesis family protein